VRAERTARQWGRDFVKNYYTDWEAWTTLLSCAREQNCPLLAENVNQQEADNLFFQETRQAYHVTLIPSERLALELSGMPSLLCLPSM